MTLVVNRSRERSVERRLLDLPLESIHPLAFKAAVSTESVGQATSRSQAVGASRLAPGVLQPVVEVGSSLAGLD